MDNQDMTYSYGYELAKSEYEKLSTVPATSQEWVAFFHNVTQGIPVLEAICGVASFITSAEAKKINKGQFNKEIRSLGNAPKQYSEDAYLLARHQLGNTDIDIISSAIGLQNICIVCVLSTGGGKIGLERFFDAINGHNTQNAALAELTYKQALNLPFMKQ